MGTEGLKPGSEHTLQYTRVHIRTCQNMLKCQRRTPTVRDHVGSEAQKESQSRIWRPRTFKSDDRCATRTSQSHDNLKLGEYGCATATCRIWRTQKQKSHDRFEDAEPGHARAHERERERATLVPKARRLREQRTVPATGGGRRAHISLPPSCSARHEHARSALNLGGLEASALRGPAGSSWEARSGQGRSSGFRV